MNAPMERPSSDKEQLSLAREAYRLFQTRCFWFMRPDLEITEANLPLIIRGLRTHGGHAGYALAARLCR
ncbi:hypothetical protein BH20VER2_BH20VER2_03330 [soil metagenome]